MRKLALFPLVAALGAATSYAQAVHVVDVAAGPGVDFTSVREAVLAAASGDVVLVRAGDYLDDVEIDGKSLILVEEAGAEASILTLEVRNVPASGFVAVRGLELDGGGVTGQPAHRTFDCAGPVWYEDMIINGEVNPFIAGAGIATNSSQVVFVRCHFEGPFNLALLPTYEIVDSSVTMYETLVEGLSAPPTVFVPQPGEDAIRMTDGELFLYGSTVLGGSGGDGIGTCVDGAPGGHGIILDGTNPAVTLLDSVVRGGAGGTATGTCTDGADGMDYVTNAPGATIDTVVATARSYVLSSPVREGGMVQITFVGQPGDLVWVRYPTVPGPSLFSGLWDGPFVLGLPAPRQFVGTLDATGTLVLNAPFPDLGAGTDVVPFFTQAIFLGSRFVMGTPSLLVVLDASF